MRQSFLLSLTLSAYRIHNNHLFLCCRDLIICILEDLAIPENQAFDNVALEARQLSYLFRRKTTAACKLQLSREPVDSKFLLIKRVVISIWAHVSNH